ncbi:MAG: sulfatase-like hydrolase/transferase [Planctomycetota bacterium]
MSSQGHAGVTLLLLLTTGCALPGDAVSETRVDGPPNVIVVLTDDQGSVDLGCYGAGDLTTPHLDALAARGLRFTQFYSAAPVCSPSRAGLLTGRAPQRAGLPGNASSQPGGKGLPTEEVTLAEMFRAAGYATGHVGKWHLGYRPGELPNDQGFDSSFGHMGGCIDNWSHFFYWNGPNRHDLHRDGVEVWRDGEFFVDLMAEECEAFLERHRSRPFFLYWALNTPHYPLQGTDAWREHYADLPSPRREYAAFVSTTDEAVGRVLGQLDALGLSDNTIVVFQSDHGHSTEVRSFGGGGSAGPYRGAKFSLFEGGIRVPAILSWPGRLPRGEVREQAATALDWMPTLADLCGVAVPERRLDGKSLVSVLAGADAPSPHAELHWGNGKSWAARTGRWKLIANPKDTSNTAPLGEGDQRFLVDLDADVGERINLAAEQPAEVERLEALHDAWAAEL